jgi:hypothetical protein
MNEFARKALELADAYADARCGVPSWSSIHFTEPVRAARAALVAHLEGAEQKPLTDERIDHIAEITIKAMPDGIRGFMKVWGWQQFARNLAEILATPTSATPTEEQSQ